jgi:hypothetical protein
LAAAAAVVVVVVVVVVKFVESYRLVIERRFACPNDPESYAGGSVSSW